MTVMACCSLCLLCYNLGHETPVEFLSTRLVLYILFNIFLPSGFFYHGLCKYSYVALPHSDKFKGHMSRRLYYVDLRENQRGRFLKISMVTDDKKFIAVPGEVLVDFRDKFAKLLDKFPLTSTTDPSSTSSPVTRSITVDRKTFYFDIVENKRGVFVKVTEVSFNLSI